MLNNLSKTQEYTADYIWKYYYNDIAKLIMTYSSCDEDTAKEYSHQLYLIAKKRNYVERCNGCNMATWISWLIRSYIWNIQKAATKNIKPLSIDKPIVVNDGEQIEITPLVETISNDNTNLNNDIATTEALHILKKKYSNDKLKSQIIELLINNCSQSDISRILKKSKNKICKHVKDIRKSLRRLMNG